MTAVVARIRKLYVAHLLLVILGAGGLAMAATYFENPAYYEHVNLTPFAYDPFGAIWKLLILYHQIGYLNILPLYIVLLAWLLVLLALARRSILLVLAVSGGIWLVTQYTRVNFPAFPDAHGWYFNPFAWQFLFSIGVAAGLAGRRGLTLPRNRWVIAAAAGYALFAFLMMAPWTLIPGLAGTRLLPLELIGWPTKTHLSIYRLASVLSLAYLIAVLVPPQAAWLQGRISTWIGNCGRSALEVFCLGTLLSFAGFVYLLEAGRGIEQQVAVNVVGLGTLGLVAWLLALRRSAAKRGRTQGAVGVRAAAQ